MKDLILTLILLFIFLFCLNTKAKDWTEITKGENGHVFFVDMIKLNENKGYIYFC